MTAKMGSTCTPRDLGLGTWKETAPMWHTTGLLWDNPISRKFRPLGNFPQSIQKTKPSHRNVEILRQEELAIINTTHISQH